MAGQKSHEPLHVKLPTIEVDDQARFAIRHRQGDRATRRGTPHDRELRHLLADRQEVEEYLLTLITTHLEDIIDKHEDLWSDAKGSGFSDDKDML